MTTALRITRSRLNHVESICEDVRDEGLVEARLGHFAKLTV